MQQEFSFTRSSNYLRATMESNRVSDVKD